MQFPKSFIGATEEKNEYEQHLSAPCFRKIFFLERVEEAVLQICGLGFYRAFVNGKEITKGRLAPYISNTDDAVYYDCYRLKKQLKKGVNELTVLLGNGLQNGIGGEIFGFDKAPWRSAPMLSLACFVNDTLLFEADESFEWRFSPITFDDLWAGEHYDARLEGVGEWKKAKLCTPPSGEKREGTAFSIQVEKEVKPKQIFPYQKGFVYDFGVNTAGVCRLKINADEGQKISLYHFEIFQNGEICTQNISFGARTRAGYWQRDEYITKAGENCYEPSFTYHGFRYVYVEGLTEKQATRSALTMLVMTASVPMDLQFSCSDKRLETLFAMVLNSNKANFFYYPTDCPHREKNGWTGDIRLSAEQFLLSGGYEAYLREWLFGLRKAQREDGDLPRIVPGTEWAFTSGASGPSWDGVLTELPYQLYRKTKDKQIIEENLLAIYRYLLYLSKLRDEHGLFGYGLSDREETFTGESSAHNTPPVVTDVLTAIELCSRTEKLANEVENIEVASFARTLGQELKEAFKKHRVDGEQRVVPFTQTGQCLLLSAGVFEGEEEQKAFLRFKELLQSDGVVKMGVLGYRKLFETLARFGETQLAYSLLLTENYSGYLYYVKKGMTSMPESFLDYEEGNFVRKDGGKALGLNHHWYGHILASVFKYIVGFGEEEGDGLRLMPSFVKELESVSAQAVYCGHKVAVSWKKQAGRALMKVKSGCKVTFPERVGEYRLQQTRKVFATTTEVYQREN